MHTEGRRRKIQARQNRGRRGVRKLLERRRLNATANSIQGVRNVHFVIVVEGEAQEMGQPASIEHQFSGLMEEDALSLSLSKFQSVITITIRSESHFFGNSLN